MAQLQVRRQGEVLRLLPLEMRLLSIGRTPDNGLPLRDSAVAIRHAEISVEGGVYLLTMLSAEPHLTFVNGQRLSPHQPHRLEQGDEIQIGPFTVAFLPEDRPAPDVQQPRPRGQVVAQGELGTVPVRPPVPTYPAPQPQPGGAALYHQFLPPFFQESPLLGQLLKVFETIWEPLQVRQNHLDAHFDARLCPPEVLGWMAGWLGAPLERHWPEGRQRAWMHEVVNLYRWRGTRYGLSRALETVYGVRPVLIEDQTRPHTLTVRLPDSPDGEDSAGRDAVTRFIHQHAPAHALIEVEFVDAPTARPAAPDQPDEAAPPPPEPVLAAPQATPPPPTEPPPAPPALTAAPDPDPAPAPEPSPASPLRPLPAP